MSAAREWLMAGIESPWRDDPEIDLWFYRQRTVALLKRYARASVEVGRLPSVLGRECFRSRLTSYSMMSFEDVVIFVHDMEQAIGKLGPLQRKLVAMSVLEDYSQAEIARLLGCPQRTVERFLPEAVDELSRVLLRVGLLDKTPCAPSRENPCQEGKNYEIEVSRCN
jgi:DNA-directed RNA polymerase specialized sigma24 family protein